MVRVEYWAGEPRAPSVVAVAAPLSKIEHTNVTKINIGGEKSVGQWRRRRIWQSGLTKRFVNC
jgi:hypothetical protein